MKRWKILLYSLLISIPAFLIGGGGIVLMAVSVPKLIRNEPRRITMHYREVVEELIAHPDRATYVGPRKKGWRQKGKLVGWPWGWHPEGEEVEVWHQEAGFPQAKEWRSVRVPAVGVRPYARYCVGGGFAILLLFALTVWEVWQFVRFVKERDDFLAATAHDLTTPLVGLRMCLGRDEAESRVLTERMLRLVDNIKDFLRLGGRRPKPKAEAFDLMAAYREAYALFAADYRDLFEGEDVAVEGAAEMPALGDETLTVQILWNLLGNDLKYAAPYGRVRVRFAQEGGRVKAEFIDEGRGMTARQMRKAFDRYYRARTVTESGKGGFGIGLCTAREFARAMGGDLTVCANRPKGCIFTLYLPAAV